MITIIEKYIKFIPIATLILIVASSIKLAIYYGVFNINIVDYLNISEYIPLFIDDLHSLMYAIGTMLIGFTIAELTTKKERPKEQEKTTTDNGLKESINLKRYTYSIFTVILLIGLPIFIYFRYDSISERLENTIGPLIGFMLSLLMLFTIFKKVGKMSLVLWLLIFAFVPLIITGYKDAYVILDKREKLIYSVHFKNDKFELQSDLKFIGNSDKYIFLYNSNNHESVIQLISNVDEIRIREK